MKRLLHILLAIALIMLLASCRTVKPPAPSQDTSLHIRDSVVLTIRDSIRIIEVYEYRDSVIYKDSTVTVVDENGNVLRTENYRLKELYKDSEKNRAELQDKYNKLLQESAKQDSTTRREPYIVEAQLSKWEQFKLSVGGYLIGTIIGIAIFFLIKHFWSKK